MATAASCEEQEPVTIADRVFNQLREAILGGRMAPGQKISEPELASSYGVSRGSLREAIALQSPERLILSRSDSETALEVGRALGISMFQGYHLDHLLVSAMAPEDVARTLGDAKSRHRAATRGAERR